MRHLGIFLISAVVPGTRRYVGIVPPVYTIAVQCSRLRQVCTPKNRTIPSLWILGFLLSLLTKSPRLMLLPISLRVTAYAPLTFHYRLLRYSPRTRCA